MPAATGGDYSAAKAAVNNLTVSLAKSVGPDDITVNAVLPGPVLTPKLEAAFRQTARDKGLANGDGPWAEVEHAVMSAAFDVPVGRVGRVEEVAHVVTVLCSPLSSFINGVKHWQVDYQT